MASPRYPDGLTLLAALEPPFPAAAAAVLKALGDAGFPPVVDWSIPADAPPRRGNADGAAEALAGTAADSAEIRLRDRHLASLYTAPEGVMCELYLNAGADPARVTELLRACTAFARDLLSRGLLRSLLLRRQGGGADVLPQVPVAEHKTHLVLASDDEVRAEYETPAEFWDAGWKEEGRGPAGVLLSRALGAADGAAFLEQVYQGQWRMAWAARAGRTRVFAAQPLPGEEKVVRAGAPLLQRVGYDEVAQEVEYAGYVEEGEHVRGFEVLEIAGLAGGGTLPDGRPVKGVRVVFPDRAMAEREKRLLRDAGARVCYEGDDGELHEVSG